MNAILGRPKKEGPFLLRVAGYPAEHAVLPEITKKPFEEIATFV